jgi:protein TonB
MVKDKLKQNYRKVFELSLVIALSLLVVTFYSFQKYEHKVALPPKPDIKLEVIKIPITKMPEKPPRPQLPSVPVGSEDDEILDDVSIDLFDTDRNIDLSQLPPPPKDDEPETFEYISVSFKPKLVKRVRPVYPDLARRAGIQGTVVVRVLIDEKGNVEKAVIFKSIPMLDEAALAAAKQFKFIPGKQRDKNVKVWMAIPFVFKLK